MRKKYPMTTCKKLLHAAWEQGVSREGRSPMRKELFCIISGASSVQQRELASWSGKWSEGFATLLPPECITQVCQTRVRLVSLSSRSWNFLVVHLPEHSCAVPALTLTGVLIASIKLYLQLFVYYQFSLLVPTLLLHFQIKKTNRTQRLPYSWEWKTKNCHHLVPAMLLNKGWWQTAAKAP